MEKIIKYNDLNIENIKYDNPRKIGNIYYSDITYNGNPLFIQTEKLNNLTNTKELNFKKPSELKFTVDTETYGFFSNLDEKNINTITDNSYEWFSKQLRLEDSENMYKNITKSLINKNLPELKFKLPILKGELLSKIYNQEKIDINIKDITINQECILIIHIRGIKFFKSYYICDYYITHIKTYSKLNFSIPDKCIIESGNNYDHEILDEEILNKNNNIKIMKENQIKLLENQLNKLNKELNNI